MSDGPGRRCIACGSPTNSREHVIPQWLSEHLGLDRSWSVTEREVRWDDEQNDAKVTHAAERTTTPARDKTVKVCAACNTGWMSQLEVEAAPLLIALSEGRPVSPSIGGASTLGRWMLKTAVMFHLGGKSTEIIGLEFPLMRAVRTGFLSNVRVSAGWLEGGQGLTLPTFNYVQAGPAVALRAPNGFDFRIGLGECALRVIWLDQSGAEHLDLLRGDDGLMSMLPIDYGDVWTTHHWTMAQFQARVATVEAPGGGGI